MEFVFDRAANIVGQGENAGHQRFLFFFHYVFKGFFLRVIKCRHCVVKR